MNADCTVRTSSIHIEHADDEHLHQNLVIIFPAQQALRMLS